MAPAATDHLPGVVRMGHLEHPREARVDHCDTGNTAGPHFPAWPDGSRERYDWERGWAAHLVVLTCRDCGTELVRYTRLRRLVKPKSRLSWRRDADDWRSLGR